MRRPSPLVGLLVAVAGLSAFQVAYAVANVAQSAGSVLLASYCLSWALLLWIVADARYRRCVPCFDFGLLAVMYFPVSLIWYVLWSRGRRGVLLLIGLFALTLTPAISFAVAWLLVQMLG